MAKTSFYVQLEPEFYAHRGIDGERALRAIRAERITKRRPVQPLPGVVTVKLTVDIPDEAFYPLRPEAVVTIPAELTQTSPVEVTAEAPDE
jgi:hypothetical protein